MQPITFDLSSLKDHDRTTVRWVIVHRSHSVRKFVSWCSELVQEGTPAAKQQEVEAHKALDRAYGGPLEATLVKQTHRTIRTVEEVPAIWEVKS